MGKSTSAPPTPVPTNSVTNSAPWTGQQPFLNYGFEQAQAAFQNAQWQQAHKPFTPSAATVEGQKQILAAAQKNAPLLQAGQAQLQNTLNGDYMKAGNPYLQAMMEQTIQGLKPTIDGQFAAAGRYGSGAYANALDSSLANAASNLAFQQYSLERGNQVNGLTQLPAVAAEQYSGANAIAAIGASQDAAKMNQLNAPFDAIGKYMGLVNGNYGSSSTQQTSYYTPPAAKTGIIDTISKLF
ncbi:MAG: hypothetical protein QM523_11185 [Candidatus Pacebacteria bacterium]|nr:hypothetical protein [Candidatus Paceibacterota bacterium]